MRIASLLILLLTVVPLSANADSKAGVTMADQITVGGKELKLNGMGLREATALKIDVYVAGLYVENPSSNPSQLINANETKVIMLTFVRDVDRGDVTKAFTQGFKGAAVAPGQLDQLTGMMTDMKKGQTLKFTYVPGSGVMVDVAGQRKGTIQGEEFARGLLGVWLGSNPPSGALKKGLLGNHAAAAAS